MTAWAGIIEMVKSKQAITDVLGSDPLRLYPIVLPQGLNTYPAATYRTVSRIPNRTFDGRSCYDYMMVDIHVMAQTHRQAAQVADIIRDNIEDIQGVFDGVRINGVSYMDSGEDGWLDTIKKYSHQIEFKIDIPKPITEEVQ